MYKKNEVQVVMSGHSISVCDMTGHFLATWEVNKHFRQQYVIDYIVGAMLEVNDVSYKVFPWLEALRP